MLILTIVGQIEIYPNIRCTWFEQLHISLTVDLQSVKDGLLVMRNTCRSYDLHHQYWARASQLSIPVLIHDLLI